MQVIVLLKLRQFNSDLLNSVVLPIKSIASNHELRVSKLASRKIRILIFNKPLDVSLLYIPVFVEIKKFKQSLQLGRSDRSLVSSFNNICEYPSKIIKINEPVKVSVKCFEGLFNSDAFIPNPVLDLLYHLVLPVEVVSHSYDFR